MCPRETVGHGFLDENSNMCYMWLYKFVVRDGRKIVNAVIFVLRVLFMCYVLSLDKITSAAELYINTDSLWANLM